MGEHRTAGFRERALLLACVVAGACALGQVASAWIGVDPLVALLSGTLFGAVVGTLCAGPIVARPALATDARRRAIIDRIESVARTDREALFDSLLEFEGDSALGPLSRSVHDALVRAHADRLEAASLRREMRAQVERETSKRTATLTNEAERDALTGLLNRRGFERRLEELVDEARERRSELVLLAIDLDEFKRLNDTCGHEKGDEALRIAGDLIRAHTRDGDVGARVGGDELFLVMRGVDSSAALGVGERLIAFYAQHPAGADDRVPWPGMSVGLARFLADGAEDAEHLRRLADQALYTSKRAGRGLVSMLRAA